MGLNQRGPTPLSKGPSLVGLVLSFLKPGEGGTWKGSGLVGDLGTSSCAPEGASGAQSLPLPLAHGHEVGALPLPPTATHNGHECLQAEPLYLEAITHSFHHLSL